MGGKAEFWRLVRSVGAVDEAVADPVQRDAFAASVRGFGAEEEVGVDRTLLAETADLQKRGKRYKSARSRT